MAHARDESAERETTKQLLHDFISGKFAIRRSINVPPLLKRVTTLLCETLVFKTSSFKFIIAVIVIVIISSMNRQEDYAFGSVSVSMCLSVSVMLLRECVSE